MPKKYDNVTEAPYSVRQRWLILPLLLEWADETGQERVDIHRQHPSLSLELVARE